MLFVGGLQLICLGLLGEYIARIHNEVMGRPIYVIDRCVEATPPAGADRLDCSGIASESERPIEPAPKSQVLT